MGFAFLLPQKMIGPSQWGIYSTAQAILTTVFMLSDSLALQAMVNFGVIPERRNESLTIAAIVHTLFCVVLAGTVYLGRTVIADTFSEPQLVTTLSYFPLVTLGYLVRTYFLKVAQLTIDTRATFFIETALSVTTIGLIVVGWNGGWLATASDMMMIAAVASGVSSLVGLWFFRRSVRFTRAISRDNVRQMLRLGLAQFGSAATMALQTQGDTLILKWFASSAVVGNYDAAKKFFRGFEAMRDAASLLVYPAVAKLAAEKRQAELVLLLEKMIGFMMIAVTPVVVAIWLGPTGDVFNWIYKGKYDEAAVIFQYLSLAALVLPFTMNTYVLGALSEARRYFRVTLTAAVVSVVAMFVLVPPLGGRGAALGVLVSYVMLGVLATRSVRDRIPFSMAGAFGRWRDALQFVRQAWRRVRGGRG